MAEAYSLPDSQSNAFVPPNALPQADPSDAILYMAQLDKAMAEIKDVNLKKLATEELRFFKMATAIIARSSEDGKVANEYYDAIRVQFGTGIDAVKKLAAALRDIAMKKKAEQILNEVAKAEVTKDDGSSKGGTVLSKLSNNSPFHFD